MGVREEEEEEGKMPISGMTEQIEQKQRGSAAILPPSLSGFEGPPAGCVAALTSLPPSALQRVPKVAQLRPLSPRGVITPGCADTGGLGEERVTNSLRNTADVVHVLSGDPAACLHTRTNTFRSQHICTHMDTHTHTEQKVKCLTVQLLKRTTRLLLAGIPC